MTKSVLRHFLTLMLLCSATLPLCAQTSIDTAACDTLWLGTTPYISSAMGVSYQGRTYNITIHKSVTGTNQRTGMCDSMRLDDSRWAFDTGSYRVVMQTSNGCDSVFNVIINEVQHAVHNSQTVVECDSYLWPRNNFNYTYSTTDVVSYSNPNNDLCVNTDTLKLTINYSFHDTVSQQACGSYFWPVNNGIYNSSGLYCYQMMTANHCDSIRCLNLIIDSIYHKMVPVTSCQGIGWQHNQDVYYEPVTIIDSLQSTAVCDSIVTYQLTVNACDGNGGGPTVTCPGEIVMPLGDDTTIYLSHPRTFQFNYMPSANFYSWSPSANLDDIALQQPTTTLYPDSTVTFAVTTFTPYQHELLAPWLQNDTMVAPELLNYCTQVAVDPDSYYQLTMRYLPVGSVQWQDTLINFYNLHATTISLCPAQYFGASLVAGPSVSAITQFSLHRFCVNTDSVIVHGVDGTSRDTLTTDACNSYQWQGNTYTQSGIYTDTLPILNHRGCDSVLYLNLTMYYSDTAVLDTTVCDNFSLDNYQYTTSGTYSPEISTVHGCDSVIHLTLTVNNSTTAITRYDTVCDSFIWDANQRTYMTSGLYLDTIQNMAHCDSLVSLALTVKYSTVTSFVEHVCDTFYWSVNDSVYRYTTMDTSVRLNAVGCDSVNYLDLHVGHATTADPRNEDVCDSFYWDANQQTYYATGIYLDTIQNIAQCDSMVTLNLTVRYRTPDTTHRYVDSCDRFYWNITDSIYTLSASSILGTTPNSQQCDSVLNLHLNIRYSTILNDSLYKCDSFYWSPTQLTYYGSVVDSILMPAGNAVGCDSMNHLILHIGYATIADPRNENVCDTFYWDANQQTYYTSGVYLDTIQNIAQCDSMVTLNLTVRYRTPDTTQLYVDSCDRFYWNITDSIYSLSTASELGTTYNSVQCDSVLNLHLAVRHSTVREDSLYACDTFYWEPSDSVYIVSTHDTLLSVNQVGCDSVNYLILSVGYATTANLRTENVCDSFYWDANQSLYDTTGFYLDTILNVAQCDSAVSLDLTVRYSTDSTDVVVSCDSINWNGHLHTVSCTDTAHLINAVQCDSLVSLVLTVNYSTTHSDTVEICDTYQWQLNDSVYTTTTFDSLHIFNAVNCDSANFLHLTVHYSTADTMFRTACDRFYWSATDTIYTQSAESSDTLHTIYGCDSVLQLNLTVLYASAEDTMVHSCDSLLWHGNTYIEDGVTECDKFFSVSTTGRVYFAPGNLQYNPAQQVWRFAAHQYDRVGNTNHNISSTYNGWIDLFGWGTSGWNSGASAYQPYSTTVTGTAYQPGNNAHNSLDGTMANADWGVYNTIQNTPSGVEWRTMATHEWRYLIAERPNASQLHSTATVDGKCGMILLPDNFELPDGIDYQPNGTNFNLNIYNQQQWTILESAGAVFLPTTGYRNGVQVYDHTTAGNYWSSTRGDADRAYYLGFQSSGIYTGASQSPRSYGYAVRLVRDTLFATAADTLPLAATNGCDSIVRLKLTLSPTVQADTTVSVACDTYTWNINDSSYLLTQTGEYYDTLINAVGCDSIFTLDLTMHYSDTTRIDSVKCDFHDWNQHHYTVSGNYSDTLLTQYDCDSVVFLDLTINYSNTGATTMDVCDSFVWNNHTYLSSIIDTMTLVNSVQCDSIDSLYLTVRYSSSRYDTVDSCDRFYWLITDSIYTSSADIYHRLVNTQQCDSNNYLHMTVRHSTYRYDTITQCDSYTWPITDSAYDHSLNHYVLMPNSVQCDSNNFLFLTIHYSTPDTTHIYVDSCDRYYWPRTGETYTTTSQHLQVVPNMWDCDSNLLLHLNIRHSTEFDPYDTACDSFLWYLDHQTYTQSATPQRHLVNYVGCDSTITLHLTVFYSDTSHTDTVTCGRTVWNGVPYTESGTYYRRFSTVHGCDSTAYLHLDIQAAIHQLDSVVACDTFTWPINGQTYTESAYLNDTALTAYGCDSIHTLILSVFPTFELRDTAIACDSYQWPVNGYIYTQSGVQSLENYSSHGCDSNYYLLLTINNTMRGLDDVRACDSYTWEAAGRSFSESGTYIDTISTVAGCDSIVTMKVIIDKSQYHEYSEIICEGESYQFGNQNCTRTGTYTHSTRARNGCDSVSMLFLNVLPLFEPEFDVKKDCSIETWTLRYFSEAPYKHWTAEGDTNSIRGQEYNDSVVLQPIKETSYTLLVDYSDTGTCPQTYAVTLKPLRRVDVKIETSTPYLTNELLEFKANAVQSGATELDWEVNGYAHYETSSFVYKADGSLDSVVVRLIGSNELCADSDTVVLPIYKAQLFVPNVFTPGESNNNRFGAVDKEIIEFEMWIYNRQGLLVFHATDINDTWDGKHNGQLCEQGAYVYKIRYKDFVQPNNYRERKGSVLLLR